MGKYSLKNFEDLDTALLALGRAQAAIKAKEASMNEKINKIKESYDQDEELAKDLGDCALLEGEIEKFCIENKSEFISKRSMTFKNGRVGFRTNPPKVVQLNKKWKIESSIAFIKDLFKGKFLRQKLEIDKDLILGAYADKQLKDDDLAGVGLRVDQEESFFIETDWETLSKS